MHTLLCEEKISFSMSCHGQNTFDFRQMALIVPEREEKWK